MRRSLPACIIATGLVPPNQSVMTNPLKPQSFLRIFVSRSGFSGAYTSLIRLYDDIIVHGCAAVTASSKPFRYISLRALSLTIVLRAFLLVSALFAAKCFGDVPTPLLWIPFII